jgi:homoserine kinase
MLDWAAATLESQQSNLTPSLSLLMSTVTVRVPATTANIGAGFDCLGAALSLYNEFQFSPSGNLVITATGAEADRVSTDANNLVYQSFVKLYQHLDRTPPEIHLHINMDVPLARGLGSSATAIVGGLVGANVLAGSPFSQSDIARIATEIEGHPDNVVPALIGGCRLAASGVDRDWEICDIPWHSSIVPIVAIPNFELSTAEARSVLPATYSRADAIFNTAHLGLLLRGLETGHPDWLKAALQDRIHQPYRQTLIKGYEAVQSAAIAASAYGMVISGAGPTLLALANSEQAIAVQTAMETAWKEQGVGVQVKVLAIDLQGATVK